MTKKKQALAGAGIAAAVILVIAIIVGIVSYRNHIATYIRIGETEYLRDSVSLDLSGKQLEDLEPIKELAALQTLDLRDTGLTAGQYQDLQAALPECKIIWSVPFQDGFCSSDLTTLTVETLAEKDFESLEYLPDLQCINAESCQDYDILMKLMEQYPDLQVSYVVTFSGKQVESSAQTIDITDPDTAELMEGLQYLPDVTTVNLQGTLPEVEELIDVQQTYPDILFCWEFELFGVSVNTLTEFIDLTGIKMDDTEELERYLPCFYNLTQVDMVRCGISNADMADLNERYPDTKFVWTVAVYGTTLRTDAKYFMPIKLGLSPGGSLTNLKYCTDMVAMDFGHYGISDTSFLEYMPNLKYLIVADAGFTDLSVLSNCISLEYLELENSKFLDLWPLTNLTNLKDLNLAGVPFYENKGPGAFGDHTPLLQMTWLDRLWMPFTNLGSTRRNEIKEALQDTEMVFSSFGAWTSGFRHTPRYYAQRDILGMGYYIN